MIRPLHPLVRDGAYRQLRSRLERLQRLLKSGAPDLMIAQEAQLIGRIAPLLAPQFLADLAAERDEVHARKMFGACTQAGCPGIARHDGSEHGALCAEHEVEHEAEAEAFTRLVEEGAEEGA